MSESIVIIRSDSNLLFDACIGVVSEHYSFSRNVVWSRNDFIFLSADAWIPIEFCVGNMDDRGELFDA